ncbi:MAG: preprotein translocase subunit SecG [Alphaproteobacteria bacterium]|jgi:preprotein translocase subunit SecG|nr:preprotein translocase subunit SecG [Alphaproteobacteria bacterium]
MQTLLIVLQLFVSIALVVVVLLQRSEGGALGIGGGGGGGGMGGIFGPRGAADTLTRTTMILAVVFFATSIGLTLYSLHGGTGTRSILDSPTPAPVTAPAKPAPQTPAVPKPQ